MRFPNRFLCGFRGEQDNPFPLMEDLYRRMWADFEAGTLPTPDLANLDAYLEVACANDHEAVEPQGVEDYAGWWREGLARRHAYRPLGPDHRFWPAPAS